jgi:hypothetical protein
MMHDYQCISIVANCKILPQQFLAGVAHQVPYLGLLVLLDAEAEKCVRLRVLGCGTEHSRLQQTYCETWGKICALIPSIAALNASCVGFL